MLAGEYAVLQPGGVAVAVAVGQLVQVHPASSAVPQLLAFGQQWPVQSDAPGLAQMAWRAGQEAQRRWGLDPQVAVELRVAGQLDGRKVGLGTSAAVTVAMLRAIAAAHHQTFLDPEIAELARAAHASGQGGGSGYDVTAIAYGGAIGYHRSPDRAEPLPWPAGLAMAALFTGEPAPTADALGRRALLEPYLPQIHRAAAEVLTVWKGAQPQPILAALQQCEQQLELAATAVPGLLTAAVWAVKRHCAAHGLVGRTSGAGGGDCVLAAGSPADVAAAQQAWRAQGGAVVAVLPEQLAAATQAVDGGPAIPPRAGALEF